MRLVGPRAPAPRHATLVHALAAAAAHLAPGDERLPLGELPERYAARVRGRRGERVDQGRMARRPRTRAA